MSTYRADMGFFCDLSFQFQRILNKDQYFVEFWSVVLIAFQDFSALLIEIIFRSTLLKTWNTFNFISLQTAGWPRTSSRFWREKEPTNIGNETSERRKEEKRSKNWSTME